MLKNKKRLLIIIISAVVLIAAATLTTVLLIQNNGYVTVTFDTDGGAAVEPIKLKKGSVLTDPPLTGKDGYAFLGWCADAERTVAYALQTPLENDITLYAGYIGEEPDYTVAEETEVYLADCAVDMSFVILSDTPITAANLGDYAVLTLTTGETTEFSVSASGNEYTVTAAGGYEPGGMYRFELTDKAVGFKEQKTSIRQLTFRIHKEFVEKIDLNTGIKYIDRSLVSEIGDKNYLSLPLALATEKGLAAGDTVCLGSGVANVVDENVRFVNIVSIDTDERSCLVTVNDSAISDIISDIDVYMEQDLTSEEYMNPDTDELVNTLYSSTGTKQLTYLLASALYTSPTVSKLGEKPSVTTLSSYTDNVTFRDMESIIVDPLTSGLKITASFGMATNDNFYNPPRDKWCALQITFEYKATIKDGVEVDAKIVITQLLNVTMQGAKSNSLSNVKFDYALNTYSQTDINFDVKIKAGNSAWLDVTDEINSLLAGDSGTDGDAVVARMKQMLGCKGDYIELARVNMIEAHMPVIPIITIFSVNIKMDFVIKINFAAGFATDITFLECQQVGMKGDTSKFKVESYQNKLGEGDRYNIEVNTCGYIGLRAGFAASLTLSFNGLDDLGEIGIEVQLGAFLNVYGFARYTVEKADSQSKMVNTHLEGGIYLEAGIYLEINLVARSEVFEASAVGNLYDKEWVLFTAGDRYALLKIGGDEKEYFMHKNSVRVKDVPALSCTFVDLMTGDTYTEKIDNDSKLYIMFENSDFRCDYSKNTIHINPDRFGLPGSNAVRNDKMCVGYAVVCYVGQNMLFSNGDQEFSHAERVGRVKITWVDESMNILPEDVGKTVTATFMLSVDGKPEVMETREVIVGKAVGSFAFFEYIKDYCTTGGWDAEPMVTAIDKDTVFTYSVARKQEKYGLVYYDGEKWVGEIRYTYPDEAPIVDEAKVSGGEHLIFNGWTRHMNYTNSEAVQAEQATLPHAYGDLPAVGFIALRGLSCTYGKDVTTPETYITGSYDEVRAKILRESGTGYACYVATYTDKLYKVTYHARNRSGGETESTYSYKFGENPEYMNWSAYPPLGFEFVGWDADGDGNADYTPGMTMPKVTGDVSYTAVYRIKGGINVTVTDYSGKVISTRSLPGKTIINAGQLDEPTKPTADPRDGYEFSRWEYSYTDEAGKWYTLQGEYLLYADIIIRPVFTRWCTITLNAGDGLITGMKNVELKLEYGKTYQVYSTISGNLSHLAPDNDYIYTQTSWKDESGKLYSCAVDSTDGYTVTESATLSAVFEKVTRLYSLTVSTEKGTLPGTDKTSIKYDNLSYSEMIAQKNESITNYPAQFTENDTVFYVSGQFFGEKTANSGEYELVYIWSERPVEYTIFFNMNGGSWGGSYSYSAYVEYGSTYALSQLTPAKSDVERSYILSGWRDSNGKSYGIGDVLTVTGNLSLIAAWENGETNTYSVVLNAGDDCGFEGFPGSSVTLTGKYGEAIVGIPTPVDRREYTGYTMEFDGWDISIPGAYSENITANAKWKRVNNQYTVTYYLDGELYKTETYEFEKPVMLIALPAQVGYTYAPWSGNLTPGTDGAFTMSAYNVRFDSTKTVNTHMVSYYVDGSLYGTAETRSYGSEVTLISLSDMGRTGYTFDGWTISGDITSANGKFTMPDYDVRIDGVYSVNRYNLTYIVGGETVDVQSIPFGREVTVRADEALDGYIFSGWSTSDAEVVNGKFTMPTNNVTFTGSFSKGNYKITYCVDGNQYSVAYADFGASVTLIAEPQKIGHSFSGWSSTDVTVTDNGFTMPSKDVLISGSHTKNMYKVYYKDETGTTLAEFEYSYNSSVAVSDGEFVRKGESIGGWTLSEGSADIVNGAFLMPDEAVVFTATWKNCLTVYDGTDYCRYDSAADGFSYDGEAKLLTVTGDGLTLSGVAGNLSVFVNAGNVILDDLTLSCAGDYVPSYGEALMIFNRMINTTVKVRGTLSLDGSLSENVGGISTVAYNHEYGDISDCLLTLSGDDTSAEIIINSIIGIQSFGYVRIENLAVNITSPTGITVQTLTCENVSLTVSFGDYEYQTHSVFVGVWYSRYEQNTSEFINCTLDLDYGIVADGNLVFSGTTNGNISTGSNLSGAIDISGGYRCEFDLTGAASITMHNPSTGAYGAFSKTSDDTGIQLSTNTEIAGLSGELNYSVKGDAGKLFLIGKDGFALYEIVISAKNT